MSGRRTTPASSPPSPLDPSVEWRRRRLLEAGFPPGLAADLACSHDIDLHAVLDLVDRGCVPALAARILAPLDAPPARARDDRRC